MFLQKDEEGKLYKGIACFMIVGLKQSVPHVIQAISEVTITGEWLAEKISASLHSLAQTGFTVRGIVTDNHNSNVNAFKSSSRNLEKVTNFSYSILLIPTKISISSLTHLISSRMCEIIF